MLTTMYNFIEKKKLLIIITARKTRMNLNYLSTTSQISLYFNQIFLPKTYLNNDEKCSIHDSNVALCSVQITFQLLCTKLIKLFSKCKFALNFQLNNF